MIRIYTLLDSVIILFVFVDEGEDEPEARRLPKARGASGSSGPSEPHPAESTS